MYVILEYVGVFVLVYLIYYFLNRDSNKIKQFNKKNMPVELLYLKKIYNIDIKKIEYKSFVHTYSLVNSFIITTIYIIIIYLLNNWIIIIVVGIVLLILMFIICYGLLARYYLWKEGR